MPNMDGLANFIPEHYFEALRTQEQIGALWLLVAAAVVLLDAPLSPGRMQDMAAELRHSETAFLAPREDPMDWRLRWFTPGTEVDLCGHATLAAAGGASSTAGAGVSGSSGTIKTLKN